MTQLSYLTAVFDLPLKDRDIPRWRSAWSEMAGFEMDRFHNHKPGDEGVIYRYPQVQYRTHQGKAALLAIGDATADVQQALSVGPWEIVWNYKPKPISLDDLQLEVHDIQLTDHFFEYRLCAYLPFNDRNFNRWKAAKGLLSRIKILQGLLAGHLLNFATGIGWKIPRRFEVEITNVEKEYSMPLHGVQRPAFDLTFRTDLQLPPDIGLGKGVSHGYGILKPRAFGHQSSKKAFQHFEIFS